MGVFGIVFLTKHKKRRNTMKSSVMFDHEWKEVLVDGNAYALEGKSVKAVMMEICADNANLTDVQFDGIYNFLKDNANVR